MDDDQTLTAVARAVAGTVSAVSPFGIILGNLFGAGQEEKPLQLDNKAARDRIESIAKMRKLLQDLFALKAGGKRVAVFIDDLDRCMPDVALDLLEAIQVFLDQSDSIFIVAADQELVGQGLKARFKDLLGLATSDQDRDFYARKGREYFEKIIQFGVPVPEPSAQLAHGFIAATFPAWAGASDLINAALGTNPRRVKQYVSLLQFHDAVGRLNGPAQRFAEHQPILDKVVSIRWRDQTTCHLLRTAIASTKAPIDKLPEFEQLLAQAIPKQPAPDAGVLQSNPALVEAYSRAVNNRLLANLLLQPPLLSSVDPALLETLLGLCDFIPDARELAVSKDPAFLRILRNLMREIPIVIDSIVSSDFGRLLQLTTADAELIGRMVTLAAAPAFGEQMAQIEKSWDANESGQQPQISPGAQAVKDYFTHTGVPAAELARRRNLLVAEPRLSAISPGVVIAFGRARALPGAASISDGMKLAQQAQSSLTDWSDLTRDLRWRTEAAELCVSRRRFAKGDLFVYCWQDVAARLAYRGAEIRDLEITVLQGNRPAEELWGNLASDDNLFQFLRLRPYLQDMYPGELTKIAAAAQVAATPASVPEKPVTPRESVVPTKPAEVLPPSDASLIFKIVQAVGSLANTYDISLTDAAANQIKSWRSRLDPPGDLGIRNALEKNIGPFLADRGALIFDHVLGDAGGILRARTLSKDAKSRLFFDLSESKLMGEMSWETLYIKDLLSFPVLANDWSIVRLVPSSTVQVAPPTDRPLSMLALLSAAGGLTTAEASRLLKEPRTPPINWQILEGGLSLDRVRKSIEELRPDILYYFGHATAADGANEAALLFDETEVVSASSFSSMFQGVGVSLAVLLGDETVVGGKDGIQGSVAGRLVASGTACVIGTTRAITVEAALLFTKAFLPALFESGSVESALAVARHALERAGMDWSAYALVSSVTKLENLNFSPRAL
jgi:hypothetical protein